MFTAEYGKRLIGLFESGKATAQQKAELVGAVLSACENDLGQVKAINEGIGFDPAEVAA